MPLFTKQLALNLFNDLFTEMVRKTDFAHKMAHKDLSVLIVYNDPDVTIYLDGDGPMFEDDANGKSAVITMEMPLDTAHYFWLKKLNVSKTLAQRLIKAKGPAGKIIELLMLLGIGQAMYPDYCKRYGLSTETEFIDNVLQGSPGIAKRPDSGLERDILMEKLF
jgi:hypothetical protein